MNPALFELNLLFRTRLAAGALIFLFFMCILALWNGRQSVRGQQEALARITAAHDADNSRITDRLKKAGDAGSAAYYTPHLTWDTPSPLAFAAFGQRDLQPSALRVRALGLHAQLYESETINPDLALPGRLDFAFILIYLVPLIIIALIHDLVTSERESRRLRLMQSLPVSQMQLWLRRTAVRALLVFVITALPFSVSAWIAGADIGSVSGVLGISALYIAFWFGLSLLIAARAGSSASAAAILLSCFVVFTLVLPTVSNVLITRAVPVAKGIELTLAQRQEVHQGWDLPKDVTFEKFFLTHPEWRDTPPVKNAFHWKWYFAMHQAGDDAVSPMAKAYRQSLIQRENLTQLAGYILPSVSVQTVLHRLANTDLQAYLNHEDQIARYHKVLRQYFYPYMFRDQKFGAAELAALPRFTPAEPDGGKLPQLYLATAFLTLIISVIAMQSLRRIRH